MLTPMWAAVGECKSRNRRVSSWLFVVPARVEPTLRSIVNYNPK
jgi:hypothetical protein